MPSADPRGVAIAEQAKSRSIFKFALPAIRKRPYSVHDFIKHHGSAHMLRMREFLREAAAHPEHKIEDAVFLNAFKLLATNPAEFEALAKAKGQDGQIAGLSSADSGWVAMLVENRSVNQSGQV